MRWGIRRFQNYDGSYTEAGKARYGRGDSNGIVRGSAGGILNGIVSNNRRDNGSNSDSNDEERPSKKKKEKNPIEKVTSGIAKSSSGASRIVQRYSKKKNYKSPASEMSDEELRRVINRMNMERQYDQLTNADTKEGYDKIRDIIDSVGDVAVTVGGIVTAIGGGIEIYKFLKGR